MKRVFISYSRRNKTFAERLARDLDDAGLDVWIDFRQISGGELWQNEIYRGIELSEFIIFCISPDSVESVWCNKEVAAAREQDKLIIPIMVVEAYDDLQKSESLSWILDVHFLSFVDRYEQAYPELLEALPGARPVGAFDLVDPENVQNPFKGLEAFQQTDSHFFFGREKMIERSLKRMQETRFLALVGASGSGKSSLVRAGLLPALRKGKIPNSDTWRTAIFTPGSKPLESLVTRIMPYLGEDDTRTMERVIKNVQDPEIVQQYINNILADAHSDSRLLIVIDQFEEVFTRASSAEAEAFIKVLVTASEYANSRLQVIVTMRSDFFGNLGPYPALAQLFEQENMIIVTDMTVANIRRAIEGPVQAVGLKYETGLVDRILDDVRSQPGSLPLLQYALRQLFDKRDGTTLTQAAYDEIGGVRKALAQHAEEIFSSLTTDQQEVTRRLLLRLVEVGESGDATRRKVDRSELQFSDIDALTVNEVIDLLTAADSRLLIVSREIRTDESQGSEPLTWLEVSHEALIREWDRFKTWVSSRLEDLQYNTELRKLSQDWVSGGRDSAYLLVGKRLTRAEVWIEDADANDLQQEFIAASLEARHEIERLERERQENELEEQRKTTARFRLLSILLVIGFVGSLIGVVITIATSTQLETANEQLSDQAASLLSQQKELEQAGRDLALEANESRSLALSAEANKAFIDRDTDLALALAINAIGNQGDVTPIRSQNTLNDIALAAGTRKVINTPNLTIESVAYSPDASQIATGLDNGEIIIWDIATSDEVMRWQAHSRDVTSIDYHPDGSQIISGSAGSENNLRVWNAWTGEELATLSYHTNRVTSVVYTPDGRFFISGSVDTRYVVWRNEGFEVAHVGKQDTSIDHVDVTVDPEEWVIAFADTNSITIMNQQWEVISDVSPADFNLDNKITSMRINPTGSLLIVGFVNGDVGLWDPRTGELTQTFVGSDGRVNAVDFLPHDNKVIAGLDDGTMRIWDVVTSRQTDVFSLGSSIRSLAVNRSQVRMAVSLEGQMQIWDIQGSAEIKRFIGHQERISSVVYHPNGQNVLSGSFDKTLILWGASDASIVRTYEGHEGSVVALAFNSAGSRFVSGASDRTARIWDTETAKILATLEGHTANITSVAWHPSSSMVATGSLDNRVILWDGDTGDQISVLEGHTGSITSLDFSPDGSMLVSGAFDNTLKVWDIESATETLTLSGHTKSVFASRFNGDGTQIVSGSVDLTVRIWNVESGREVRRFEGHDRVINEVAFVANSNAIISASSDGTLRLWDTVTGVETYRYTVQNSFGRAVAMRAVAINGEGRQAVTGMEDATVRQWEVLPTLDSLVQWTLDNRAIQPLTCKEQILFGLLEDQSFGQQVFVNSPDATINLLFDPTEGAVTGIASNGEAVNLIDVQTIRDDETFYQVCTADSQVGWIPDDLLDGLSD
jgi:WD40 repeat protein